MGLAASQARLLSITARKSDCEFQSMNLSHQKIALARDLQMLSDEYNAALGATKLIYDYFSSNSSQMDLSYSLLMTPGVYNEYYPKMVTDANSRVILNSKFAAAAKNAGLPAEGMMGTPSSDVRNRFIQELCNENIIAPKISEEIQNTIYGNTIGLGSTVNTTVAYETITYDDLMQKFYEAKQRKESAATDNVAFYSNNSLTADDGDSVTYAYAFLGKLKGDGESAPTFTFCEGDTYDGTALRDYKKTATYGAKHYNPTASDQVYLYDLLCKGTEEGYEGDLILGYNSDEDVEPVDAIIKLQNDIVGVDGDGKTPLLQWFVDSFSDIFGGDADNEAAIAYASQMCADILCPDNGLRELLSDPADVAGMLTDDTFGELEDFKNLSNSKYYYDYSYRTERYARKDRVWGKKSMVKTLSKGVLCGTEQWLGYLGFNGGGSGGDDTTLIGDLRDGWTYGHRANRNYYGSSKNRSSNVPNNDSFWANTGRNLANVGTRILTLGLSGAGRKNNLINNKGENGYILKDYISYVALGEGEEHIKTDKGAVGATMATINLSNVAKLFLSYFVEYQQEQYGHDYDIKSPFATQNTCDVANHEFKICKAETDLGDSGLYANFYDALFNAIATDGWVENDQIDNSEYMQEMMKNGKAFITSLGEDGYFAQAAYSSEKYIREVADTEAISKAESKYNAMKAKIQSKEDTIDLKMRNLDTEMSALSTEYETIKNLVNKNVQSSLKRYDA